MSMKPSRQKSSVLVDYVTLALFVLSSIALMVGRISENNVISAVAVVTWVLTIAFVFIRIATWNKRVNKELSTLVAEEIEWERQARGNADAATDPRVRRIWRQWSEVLDAELINPTDLSYEYQGWGLQTRQIALEQLSIMVADNPHISVHEWLKHIEEMVDGAKADDEEPITGVIAEAWDDRVRELRELAY